MLQPSRLPWAKMSDGGRSEETTSQISGNSSTSAISDIVT